MAKDSAGLAGAQYEPPSDGREVRRSQVGHDERTQANARLPPSPLQQATAGEGGQGGLQRVQKVTQDSL